MPMINGRHTQLSQPVTVEEYLLEQGYRLDRIAVEFGGSILPKGSYGTTRLGDDDVLEIVSFVGGG